MQYVALPNYLNKLFDQINNYMFTPYHNDIIFSIISYVLPNTQEMYYHHTTLCYRLGMILERISTEEKKQLLQNGISFFKKIQKGGIFHFKNNVNTLCKILLISFHNNDHLIYNVIDIEPYIINTKDISDIFPFSKSDELYQLYHNEIKHYSKPKPYSFFHFCRSILYNNNQEHTKIFNTNISKHICKIISNNVIEFNNLLNSDFEHKKYFDKLFQLFNHCINKSDWFIDDAYKIDILLHLFARSKIIYYHQFNKLHKKEFIKNIELSKFLIIYEEKYDTENTIIQSTINKRFFKVNKQQVHPYSLNEPISNINILCHNIGGAPYDLNFHLNIYKNTSDFDMNRKNTILCFQEVSNKNIKNTFNIENDQFEYVSCYFLSPETMIDYCKNNYRYGRIISNFGFLDNKNSMYEQNLYLQDEINSISENFSNFKAIKLIRKFRDRDPKWYIVKNLHKKHIPNYDEFVKSCYKKNVVNIARNQIMIHKIKDKNIYYVYCDEKLNTGKDISKHQLMLIFPKSFFDPEICNIKTHFIIGNLRHAMGHMFLGLKNNKETECIINTHLQSGDQFGTKDGIAMNEFINLINAICGSQYDNFFQNLNTIYIVGDFNLNSDVILMILENSIRIHNHFKNHKIYLLFDNVKTHTNYERRNLQDTDNFENTYNKIKNKAYIHDTDISWIHNQMKRKDLSTEQHENLLEILKNQPIIKRKGCIDNIIVITNKTIDHINLDVGHRKSTIKTAKQFEMIYKGDDIKTLKKFQYNENRLDLQDINQLSQYFLSDHSPIYTSIQFQKVSCMNYLKRFLPI